MVSVRSVGPAGRPQGPGRPALPAAPRSRPSRPESLPAPCLPGILARRWRARL